MDYFDLHCDTIAICEEKNLSLKCNNLQLSLDKGRDINKWIQTYAIWITDELRGDDAYEYFNRVYKYLLKELDENKSEIILCKNYKEIQSAIEAKKKVALLSVEGSAVLGENIDRVKEIYDKGVSMMTMTWNGKTEVGDGCMVKNAGGLTSFGKQVVKEMNKYGMIVDISHLSFQGVDDVIQNTTKPFIATHSNSYKICNHPRNLRDEHFIEIINRGGIVGMNFYPVFINGSGTAYIEELLMHISHFIKLGGEDNICLGSDFDGASMPENLRDISEIEYLYNIMNTRYGKSITDKVFYDNALRFYEKFIE